MSCTQITDNAFRHLTGIHSLNISGCIQITDQAFSHLAGNNALEIQRGWTLRNSDHQHTQKYRTKERHDADDDRESK